MSAAVFQRVFEAQIDPDAQVTVLLRVGQVHYKVFQVKEGSDFRRALLCVLFFLFCGCPQKEPSESGHSEQQDEG